MPELLNINWWDFPFLISACKIIFWEFGLRTRNIQLMTLFFGLSFFFSCGIWIYEIFHFPLSTQHFVNLLHERKIFSKYISVSMWVWQIFKTLIYIKKKIIQFFLLPPNFKSQLEKKTQLQLHSQFISSRFSTLDWNFFFYVLISCEFSYAHFATHKNTRLRCENLKFPLTNTFQMTREKNAERKCERNEIKIEFHHARESRLLFCSNMLLLPQTLILRGHKNDFFSVVFSFTKLRYKICTKSNVWSFSFHFLVFFFSLEIKKSFPCHIFSSTN